MKQKIMSTYEKTLKEAEAILTVKATSTSSSYMTTLRKFNDFPTRAVIVAVTNKWHSEGLKGSTIRQRHAAIRWLMKHFPRNFDPYDMQEAINYMAEIKMEEPVQTVATKEQTEKVMALSDSRTALIIALLYYHGLRVSDVTKLKLSDFTYTRNEGKITMDLRDKKTKQVHSYILVEPAAVAFEKYVNGQRKDIELSQKNPSGLEYLFIGTRGHLIKPSIQRIVKTACEKAGYPALHCHSFRHGCATAYAKAGVGAEVIKYVMGHKSIASSMRYIHLNADDAYAASQEVF